MQSWYKVACVFLLTVRDVETLSETIFPIPRLNGNQNNFYPVHMSLLPCQMLGKDVSFYKFGKLLTGIYLIRYLLVLMAVYFTLLLLSALENGFFVRLRD